MLSTSLSLKDFRVLTMLVLPASARGAWASTPLREGATTVLETYPCRKKLNSTSLMPQSIDTTPRFTKCWSEHINIGNIAMYHLFRLALGFIFAIVNSSTMSIAAQPLPFETQVQEFDNTSDRKKAAEGDLKFLYTMYFAIKGCTTAAHDFSKPEFLPSVNLEEVRRITANADAAAREVGIDVDGAWLIASPVGQATAEALQKDTPDNLAKCKLTGTFVRSIVARIQMSLVKLGSKRSIIEKDF